ncbi:MAG: phospholipid carrier-dependent glycosyltransferase [bacterium]|nr:phospholipid carrier-dependent glycosyltransferase [bacterium]
MLFRLGAQPIQNWDEGIHGAVSLEMVEDGDWLTPHYMGGSYFRKPPLKIWMTAGLFTLIPTPSNSPSPWEGEKWTVWALRLPSALAGIATSLLVAWWMWQWRRSRWEAFLAGAIVATMRPIFFHAFRTGEMDGVLTFFVVLSLYAWWAATARPTPSRSPSPREGEKKIISPPPAGRGGLGGWFVLCGAAIGLAVMTKSAAGLLPLPIIAAHALWTDAWRMIRIRHVLVLVFVLVIVIAPWHIIMIAIHGSAFWNDYLGWHIVKRATEALHNETAGTWWYLGTFARRFTPYTYVFVPALFYSIFHTLRAWRQRRAPGPDHSSFSAHSLLLIWFLIGFALFTIMRTKLDWYLLPLYPAAAMLTAWFLAEVRGALRGRVASIVYIIALVLLFGTGGAVTTRHLLRTEPPNPFHGITATIRGSGGVLVSYALDYKQHPAGYFILRNALRDDVRILDGQSDVARTSGMLITSDRPGFLLTRNETELPKELRQVVGEPHPFGAYVLWGRR